jgi:hypothetical protein
MAFILESEWINTVSLVSNNLIGKQQERSKYYSPKHCDILSLILHDMKLTSTFLNTEDTKDKGETKLIRLDINNKINKNSVVGNGVYQFKLLEKITCLKLIQEVINIKLHFPSAPLNSGNSFK